MMRSQQCFFLACLPFMLTAGDDAELVQVHVTAESDGPWQGTSSIKEMKTIDCDERWEYDTYKKKYGLGPHSKWANCPKCAPNSQSIWGSNPYTHDSKLCQAAQHAGIIPEAGGPFYIENLGSFWWNFSASLKHKIQSQVWTAREFGIQLHDIPIKISCSVTLVKLSEKIADVKDDDKRALKYWVTCPDGCAKKAHGVWGTNEYTADSNTCAAAIHAGIIPDSGGTFYVHADVGFQKASEGSYKGSPGPLVHPIINSSNWNYFHTTQTFKPTPKAQFADKDLSGSDVGTPQEVKATSTGQLDALAAAECDKEAKCEFWVREYDKTEEEKGTELTQTVWMKAFYKEGTNDYECGGEKECQGHGKFTPKDSNHNRRGGLKNKELLYPRVHFEGWDLSGNNVGEQSITGFTSEDLDEKAAALCQKEEKCVFWVRSTNDQDTATMLGNHASSHRRQQGHPTKAIYADVWLKSWYEKTSNEDDAEGLGKFTTNAKRRGGFVRIDSEDWWSGNSMAHRKHHNVHHKHARRKHGSK